MPILRRENHKVIMETDWKRFEFDSRFGGVPLHWFNINPFAEELVTDPFPGAGTSINWETGQDPTQAGANGPDAFPISTIPDVGSWPRSYYAHESLYDDENCRYLVEGFAPLFWASLEAHDDFIPLDTRQGSGVWSTKYHDRLGLGEPFYSSHGVPIVFAPNGQRMSGYMLIGNEMQRGRPCRIPQGKFAFYLNISMMESFPGGIAGIVLRPWSLNPTIGDVWSSPGYNLNVNMSGGIDFQKNGASMWSMPYLQTLAETIRSAEGAKIEIRTNTVIPGWFQILVNDDVVHTATDKNPVICEMMGLFATAAGGTIKFSHRHPFDLNRRFRADYKLKQAGQFVTDLSVVPTTGCEYPVPFYRSNLPGVFVNNDVAQCVKVFDVEGREMPLSDDSVYPLFSGAARSFYVGKSDGSAGVLCIPKHAEVDSDEASGAHVLAFRNPNLAAIMLNPFARSTNDNPRDTMSITLRADWYTYLNRDAL